MSFSKYPTYKNSGVEWLGEVPEHWAVASLKRGYEVVLGKMLQPEPRNHTDELLPYLRAANIQVSGVTIDDMRKMWFSAQEKEKLHLKPGDLLISEGGDVGRSAIWDLNIECYFQNAINRVRSLASRDTRFLHYWLITIKERGYIDVLCNKSTIAHFTAEKVSAVPVPYLPSFEQINIANFLDHETAKIDALIEEQQRLIELLKEKRQAVISHTVTKGLDPDATMKDSGVEWLGEVPAHWVISQLKFNALEMQTGPFGSQLHADDYVYGGTPLINPAHMLSGRLVPDPEVAVDDETKQRLERHQLIPGDIVFARRGELGRCAVVTEDEQGWLCGTGSLRVRLNERLKSEYAYILATSKEVATELSLASKGSTMDNLNTETLGGVRLPVPPVNEQAEILEYVHQVSGGFGNVVKEAESLISLMFERRSALISAAVTGKIDVRDWQPPVSSASTHQEDTMEVA